MRRRWMVLIGVVIGVGLFLAGIWLIASFLPQAMTDPMGARVRIEQRRAEHQRPTAGSRTPLEIVEGEVAPPAAPELRRLEVRVVLSDGEPAEGATLLVDEEPVGVTDAEGRYAGEIAADETHHVQAEWEDLASPREQLGWRHRIDRHRDLGWKLDMQVGLRGAVVGTVVDPDGELVADAGVRIHPEQPGGEALTDGSGAFRFEGLAPGRTRLLARKGALAAEVVVVVGRASSHGAGPDRITIELQPLPRTVVRVRDTEGDPVAGARVEAEHHIGEVSVAVTDAQGQCELSMVFDADWIEVSRAGFGTFQGRWDPLPARIEVTLEPAGALEVEARYEDGAVIPDARATYEREAPGGRARTLRLGAAGRAQVDDLPPGLFEVKLRAPGLAEPEPERVEIFPGERTRVEFVLERGGEVFAGVVQDSDDGQPIAGAKIALSGIREPPSESDPVGSPRYPDQRVVTDAEGRFEIPDLPAGRAYLEVSAAGYSSYGDPVTVPSTGRTIELLRRCVVQGRLAFPPGHPGTSAFSETGGFKMNPGGSFRATLDGNSKSMKVGAAGVRSVTRELGSACPGPVDLGEIALEPSETTTVEVLSPDGAPVAGAMVLDGSLLGVTDPEGQLLLRLSPSEGCLSAWHQSWVGSDPEACPPVGESNDRVALLLRPGGWIEGRVHGESYAALEIDQLAGTGRFHLRTDARGLFRSGVLLPGRYQVGVERVRPGTKTFGVSKVAEVRAGETVHLDLGGPADARIEGRILSDPKNRRFTVVVMGAHFATAVQTEGWEGMMRLFEQEDGAIEPYLQGVRVIQVDLAGGEARYTLEGISPGLSLLVAGPDDLGDKTPYLSFLSLEVSESRVVDLIF